MEITSAQHAHDVLCRGFYIESPVNGDPIPMISNHHRDGVIAVIYSAKRDAEEAAARLSESYQQEVVVKPINALWDSLIGFARRGIAGIMLDEEHPVFFLNRLRDLNRSLPTLARVEVRRKEAETLNVNIEDELYFGVRGTVRVNKPEILPWHNYCALDAMSVRWMLRDKPLPESILPFTLLAGEDDYVLFQNGATLLGPYVSDMGAVPVFSSEVWAEFFGLTNGVLKYEGEIAVPKEDIACKPIKGNFTDFLDRVYEDHGPFVDIGLNPTCHRFRQGFFFKASDESNDWYLRTLSGVFRLTEGQFVPSPDTEPPKNDDDVHGRHADIEVVRGLTSVARYPFKRLIGANMSQVPLAEAKDIITEEFEHQLQQGEYTPVEMNEVNSDTYVVEGFDKISGDNLTTLLMADDECEGPLFFPDFIAASHWLLCSFLEFDEEIRVQGAKTCHGPYHPGSHDTDREEAVSRAFREAVESLAVDVLANGYRQEHSLHLQRLFQDVSAVLEITTAGYLGDLLFYGEADVAEEFGAGFKKKCQSIRSRLENHIHLDENIAGNIRRMIGASFDDLQVSSKQILAAALDEFERVGRKPGYDYAGVNMKLCKVAERELKHRLFDEWCSSVRSSIGKKGIREMQVKADEIDLANDQTGSLALDFLDKRKKVELGAMRYLLLAVGRESKHPAIVSLSQFIDSRDDSQWLLSGECDEMLSRISSKYRNGGVHEHLIEYELCTEAMDYLLKNEEAAIPMLLNATKAEKK